MLHSIILAACMLTNPNPSLPVPCKNVTITVELEQEYLLPNQCQIIGTLAAAEWERDNPGWISRWWRCPPPISKFSDT